ncbi:MAG: phBC6A51 family helix-turn-helix protein, partial [Elusimicrobiota bacterium]
TAACNKINISRQTFYNWKEEDEEFKKEAERIKEQKDKEMEDFAEGKLYEHIKDGNLTSIIFYLKTRHNKYNKQRLKISGELKQNLELNEEEKKLLNRAITLAFPKRDKEEDK